MKIIIFGCGAVYQKMKGRISGNVEIVGVIDNQKAIHGKKIDGIKVFGPEAVKDFVCDYIVLMSDAASEMREQLLQAGYTPEKIIHYQDFFGLFPEEIKEYCSVKRDDFTHKKTLLIISVPLVFNGVPVVSLTTGKAAMDLGYSVTIAAEEGDKRFIDKAVEEGIRVLICRGMPYAAIENLSWMDSYDVVLVNSAPMLGLAVKLAGKRRVIVWVHECTEIYEWMKFWKTELREGIQKETLQIYAPGRRAKKNFVQVYGSQKEVKLLPLGIEDRSKKSSFPKRGIGFGLVGGFTERKGQDIFLSAVEAFPNNVLEKEYFLLIGAKGTSRYADEIIKRASRINNCILLGERTQEEMCEIYQMLDILVVASREETMSMAAIEGMMMGKVCILSDQTGMAEYIEQGKNGFVFPSGNSEALKIQMLWCRDHPEQLKKIGENARKTYEQNFTIEIFRKKLKDVLCLGE